MIPSSIASLSRLSCPNSLKKVTLETFEHVVSKDPTFFGSKIKDIITLDGMRIVFEQGGFALIRQSNTEPVFTMGFEALSESSCNNYRDVMISLTDELIAKHK